MLNHLKVHFSMSIAFLSNQSAFGILNNYRYISKPLKELILQTAGV